MALGQRLFSGAAHSTGRASKRTGGVTKLQALPSVGAAFSVSLSMCVEMRMPLALKTCFSTCFAAHFMLLQPIKTNNPSTFLRIVLVKALV